MQLIHVSIAPIRDIAPILHPRHLCHRVTLVILCVRGSGTKLITIYLTTYLKQGVIRLLAAFSTHALSGFH